MGNLSREMETKKQSKGNARNQKHCTEMKNTFDELINGQDSGKERIIEFEGGSIEIKE